jgi:aminoglycoside phosphotransferase (APT) family kinase protein
MRSPIRNRRMPSDLGAPRVPPHGRSLAGHVQELEADIRAQLRQRGSHLPVDAKVSVSPLRENASHRMAILRVEGTGRRLLVKGQPNHDRIYQSLETESRMFRTIGPQMSAGNPATRCPEMLSYYPDRGLMLLEFVDGHRLDTLQLGLARSSAHDLSRLTGLCGEWLARFHALTRLPEEANPFETLTESFRRAPPWLVHQDVETYDEVRRLAEALRRRFPDFKQPLCMIHGEFAPYHILVRDSAIHVIDFGSSRKGYPFEDLTFFTSFYDSRLPWRRLVGAIRIDFEEEKGRFLESYRHYSGAFDDRMESVMRLSRIHAMARYVTAVGAKDTWRAACYSRIAQPWVRRLFWNVCREELEALTRGAV